ncbi:MAG: hypothetical protein AB1657_01545 [Candidatus Micrarchaeota archaeon]
MAGNERLFWYSLLVGFVAILAMGIANPAMFAEAPGEVAYIIKIKDFGFVPAFSVVNSGTTVTWVNNATDAQVLSVPEAFGPQELGPGMNWSYRFLSPGVYEYRTLSAAGVLVVD